MVCWVILIFDLQQKIVNLLIIYCYINKTSLELISFVLLILYLPVTTLILVFKLISFLLTLSERLSRKLDLLNIKWDSLHVHNLFDWLTYCEWIFMGSLKVHWGSCKGFCELSFFGEEFFHLKLSSFIQYFLFLILWREKCSVVLRSLNFNLQSNTWTLN